MVGFAAGVVEEDEAPVVEVDAVLEDVLGAADWLHAATTDEMRPTPQIPMIWRREILRVMRNTFLLAFDGSALIQSPV